MTEVVRSGRKVAIRRKQIEDGEDDYSWRADPELAELDATRSHPPDA